MTGTTHGKLKSIGCLLAAFFISACGGSRGIDNIGFQREIDPRLVANPEDAHQGRPGQFDLGEWYGAAPLDGHVPILRVEDRIDMIVVESADETVIFDWPLPEGGGDLFLRIADENFEPDSCPISGTSADEGVAMLETLDGFAHPRRFVYRLPVNWASLDVTMPQLETGSRYYVQGCPIDNETGLFTGEVTNTVVIEIASALPDLAAAELRTLGRSPAALGRPFIRVEDLNAAREREVRGDTFNYRVTITPSSPDSITSLDGTARLLPGGGAWIIPGAETPDRADDIRIPDDGRIYNVHVSFNTERTGIAFPESNHRNNQRTERLMSRPKPLIFGIDQLRATENCDAVSPGDWLMMLSLDYNGRERRIIADSTIDVLDNSTTTPKMAFRLHGTNIASTVRARLGFVDCDFDLLSGFLLPGAGLVFSIETVADSCGGEEAYEVGGQSDLVGWASATLSGVTLGSDVSRTATASEENCGPAPFSVDFKLMTEEQADDDGYDAGAAFNIR